ncbi:MAG: allantoinase AllB [Verrucomicrobiota bacterium]
MRGHDLLVLSKTPDGAPLALGIEEGQIAFVGPEPIAEGRVTLDHQDGFLLPGWIDAHVHFNEPGRSDWEGLASGSKALAAGGGTVFFDMPLNSTPPVLNGEALRTKRCLAEEKSCLDFALWGGLTPDSLNHLEEMAEEGAIGFKAFLCPSGLEEFAFSDSATLRQGMEVAADLNLPIAVHAEIEPRSRPEGQDMTAWLASRPIQLELDAIALALELGEETGCALHVVHVSSAEGIDLISTAKKKGVNVTAETCPHYLLLSERDAIAIGASAKCAPPLRPMSSVEALRKKLGEGEIDTLGSDHSPAPFDLKQGDDFFAIWGGIAGIQHGLPLLLDLELDTTLTEPLSTTVASRFRLTQKGGFREGNDADFSFVVSETETIEASSLVTRHPISPYLGRSTDHRIAATYQRGEPVTSSSKGRFLQPQP